MPESCAKRICGISPREVVGSVRCTECPHFRIAQRPIHSNGDIVDTGLARCKKYDLVVDFFSERKLNKLVCVDEMEKKNGREKED